MRWHGPLADRYSAAVALVLFALVPYLALTSALTPLMKVLSPSVRLSMQALQLTTGMANAAYAVGTVISIQLAVHYPQRRLLVGYAAMFVLASAMAATALTPGLFIAGQVLQGLCTSLMLIAAAPPLVIGCGRAPAGLRRGDDEPRRVRRSRRRCRVRRLVLRRLGADHTPDARPDRVRAAARRRRCWSRWSSTSTSSRSR